MRTTVPLVLLCLCAIASGAEPDGKLRVESDKTSTKVFDGQRVVMDYRFGDIKFKPYIQSLTTPKGVEVLRDSPADHVHHHGLMFAIKVNDVNYWEEAGKAGKQVPGGKAAMPFDGTADIAGICQDIVWKNADDAAQLGERRQMWIHETPQIGCTLLTWRAYLRRPKEITEPVKLGGNHYHGLGMRFPQWMDQVGSFTYAGDKGEGVTVRGDEKLFPASWCAYTAKATDGKEVTVAMFAGPNNPRKTLWFTMTKPFSYLSGTLNYWKEPIVVEDKPVNLLYGVAAWDGKVEAANIEKAYQGWLKLNGVKQ